MLINIPPIINAEALYILASMGHGDELAIVDSNFPAASMAKKLVYLSCPACEVTKAVLSIMPVDAFTEHPIKFMQTVDNSLVPAAVQDLLEISRACSQMIPTPSKIQPKHLERFQFYHQVKSAFAVFATTETRPYGCVILTKGAILDEN